MAALMTPVQLAAWRNYYQLTQLQLAQLLGVHFTTVAKWETGRYAIPPYLGLALETIQRELPPGHIKRVRAAKVPA